jgi:hypothetical protein
VRHIKAVNSIIQLMVIGAVTELGQVVLHNVGEDLRLEPGHVTTLLQLMVVQIVLEKVLRVSRATKMSVQVKLEPRFMNYF